MSSGSVSRSCLAGLKDSRANMIGVTCFFSKIQKSSVICFSQREGIRIPVVEEI